MSDAKVRPRLLVDIVADPVCPWCYVGLKSYQHARERIRSAFQVLTRIRAYQLNPDTPEDGFDRKTYYERKFPDEGRRAQIAHALKAAAVGAGFTFDPLVPARIPNTIKAHQLIRLAHYDGVHERVAEKIYAAHWDGGADIGDAETLVAIAAEAGLDPDHARRILADGANAAEIRAEADAFRAAGVAGVPTFIVNERDGFSGALAPGRLADALTRAATGAAPAAG